MRETRTFTNKNGEFPSEAYTEDGKVWRWSSNDSVCPLDACEEDGIPCDKEAQSAARDKEVAEVVASYRKARANITTEQRAEEAYERRAAFGPGEEVVDIFTGERFVS